MVREGQERFFFCKGVRNLSIAYSVSGKRLVVRCEQLRQNGAEGRVGLNTLVVSLLVLCDVGHRQGEVVREEELQFQASLLAVEPVLRGSMNLPPLESTSK